MRWNNASLSRESLMKSIRQVRFCLKKVPLLSTTYDFQTTVTKAKTIWWQRLIEMEIEKDEMKAPEGEVDLDRVAYWVHNLFKLKNIFDVLDFDTSQHLKITKTTIELNDFLGTCHMEEEDSNIGLWFSMKRTDRSSLVIITDHFYVRNYIYHVELKRVLIDTCSSLTIMPRSTLEVVGIPHSRIVEQAI